MDEGTQSCPFFVTGNGHGRVTEPKCDHFSGRNLGMVPKEDTELSVFLDTLITAEAELKGTPYSL